MISEDIKQKIVMYHRQDYSYRLIHYLLEKRHGCRMSFHYLQQKVIPSLGLKRRMAMNITLENLLKVSEFEIQTGLAGSEQLRRTLSVKYNIRIPRSVRRDIVLYLDTDGVERRRRRRLRRRQYISKGPNYAWHLDGYDKLAPYGIFIHGCIDGFSRKVLWLEAGITNRRPEVIGSYFVKAAENEGGFPRKLRGDCGTENSLVARILSEVGMNVTFQYGKSTSNQRIERWWGYLRQARSDYWIHQFKLMEAGGYFVKENPVHRLCLQFCFMPFIRRQLEELMELWNCHSIRHQKHGDTLSGIPEVLHEHTELQNNIGVRNYIRPVPDNIYVIIQQLCQNNYLCIDTNFTVVAVEVLNKLHLPQPSELLSFGQCQDCYNVLVEVLDQLL